MNNNIKRGAIIVLASVALFQSADVSAHSKRVEDLLSRMTVAEKVGQLNQLSGWGYAPGMTAMIRAGQVSSLLNEVDPVVVNKLQKVAVDSTRLGIPLIFARDVIHGFKTMFPIPLGQAATWDAETVRQGAAIAADEASSAGVRWTFSPMVDIARDARWGRIAEGFGEDPYLTSLLGVAMVKGYQGDDLSRPNTMAACTKHFAGYGYGEGGRDYNSAYIAPGVLEDVILPPFEACAKAGSATFMNSFNEINGIPANASHYLLKDKLRKAWNYDGMVVSDWNSAMQMVPQGYARDLRDAARIAALAGMDMDMESHAYIGNLQDLVEKGEVSMAVLDSLTANVLTLKERLGLFDNPYVDLGKANRYYAPESLKAARQAAAMSAILLKNDGVLPLKARPGRIAVAGPMADAKHDQNGTWSFDMEKERTVTPLASLRERYGKKNVIDARGLEFSRDKERAHIDRAVAAAADADIILYFAGEEAVLSGEAHCRTDLTLPGAQAAELQALKALDKPVVVVVMAGRPLEISEQNDLADAIVYYFHPGTMGGPAIVDVLSGDFNPQGHLPVCLPRTSGQMPLYYAQTNTGRPASEIVLIDDIPLEAGQTSTGCTSFYLDAGNTPLYPFGYGLSYTEFDFSPVRLSSATMDREGNITATCTVTNKGDREGTTIAQLYVGDKVASLVQPVKVMKNFEKIILKPGESRDVNFTITADNLMFTDRNMNRVVEPGEFNVWIASDSQTGKPVTFNLN